MINCYRIGERLAPNRQGAVTNAVCSSRSNDIDSDGVVRETKSLLITKIKDFRTICVTGPQPYIEGENESFTGMLPVPSECGLEPQRSALAGRSFGGRMPRAYRPRPVASGTSLRTVQALEAYSVNADYNAAKNIARKLALKLQQGQKSPAGGAFCQYALKSGTMTVNATEVASDAYVSAERESTDKPTASAVGS